MAQTSVGICNNINLDPEISPAEKHFDLELRSQIFSLLIHVQQTLPLKNPSDATLSSLSNSVFSRRRPRLLPLYATCIALNCMMF